jgi:hypothetical protein
MTALWFGLAIACLAGAGALLYIDRLRRMRTGRVRQAWAKGHGYSYKAVDPTLAQQWRRATLAKQAYLSAVDIATGTRRGVRFTLFDLEDAATIVAVQRRVGSDVDIDLRLKTTPPPKDPDLELLGAMGDHVVFATDIDIARRVADQRMAALAEILPDNLQVLWSENTWTLGSLPVTATTRDWDQAIDGVIRFSGLLHVLPPEGEYQRTPQEERDEAAPAGSDEEFTQAMVDPADHEAAWDNRRRRGLSAEDFEPVEDEARAQEFVTTRYEDDAEYEVEEYDEPASEPGRREGVARGAGYGDYQAGGSYRQHEGYRNQEADNEQHQDGESADESGPATRPGGPFHPGFRPYQGPTAR